MCKVNCVPYVKGKMSDELFSSLAFSGCCLLMFGFGYVMVIDGVLTHKKSLTLNYIGT
jgi:hypothetical protein